MGLGVAEGSVPRLFKRKPAVVIRGLEHMVGT